MRRVEETRRVPWNARLNYTGKDIVGKKETALTYALGEQDDCPHILKRLDPSTSPSLILDGIAQTGT